MGDNYESLSNDEVDSWGDDAQKWAKGFNEAAVKLGYSEMDEGWLIGWFANAIERSYALRRDRVEEKLDEHIEQLISATANIAEALGWT